jgi:hypoxanthine phosphoribosyltransferase
MYSSHHMASSSTDFSATVPTVVTLHDKRFMPLISRDEIRTAVQRLGSQISADYNGKNPVFVIVLKGSTIFASDLVREVTVPCEMEFLKAESYGHAMQSSGTVTLNVITPLDITGKDVIVVEDIIDTGLTLKEILAFLKQKNPASVRIATLLLKPDICKGTVEADYVGFEISPLFVVGYGLDYDEIGRNLPDVYVLSDDTAQH